MKLDISLEQPPDWMRFSRTHLVAWHEVEAMALRHAARIREEHDLLVAIMRAGSPVATMLARHTGLPIDYLVCSRRNPQPFFLDGEARAPRGRRILLVDDVCGSGWTFERARRHCEALGNVAACFSVYRCRGDGMYLPDYAMEMDERTYLRWPWEYQEESEMPAATTAHSVHSAHSASPA